MSRIGKKPIPLPNGVKITVGEELEVTGPKGKLKVPIPEGITFEQADGKLEVKRSGDEHAAIHGLTRALDGECGAGRQRRVRARTGHRRHRLSRRRQG